MTEAHNSKLFRIFICSHHLCTCTWEDCDNSFSKYKQWVAINLFQSTSFNCSSQNKRTILIQHSLIYIMIQLLKLQKEYSHEDSFCVGLLGSVQLPFCTSQPFIQFCKRMHFKISQSLGSGQNRWRSTLLLEIVYLKSKK